MDIKEMLKYGDHHMPQNSGRSTSSFKAMNDFQLDEVNSAILLFEL